MSDDIFRRDGMFPTLTPAQTDRLRPLGSERTVADREILFEQGSENVPFHVVLDGGVAIYVSSPLGEHVVVVHEPGGFVGDIDTLSGRGAVVAARAQGPTRLLVIDRTRLHQVVQLDAELSEILLRAFILRRLALVSQGRGDLVVLGSRYCAYTLRLEEFLTRNGRPHTYLDLDREENVQTVLDSFNVGVNDVPVVVARGTVLKHATIEQVAELVGINRVDQTVVRDVIVIGAGPAGLAAGVYAASEGLDVLVIESESPGGQAGTSSRIENYLGFPTGISGLSLTGRAFIQAEKFGAEISVARTAIKLACERRPYRVELPGEVSLQAKAIIIATGAKYRKPEIENLKRFEGMGVYYAATQLEANYCNEQDVIVVGGGNSAGQAAVFLSGCARKVHMLVRAEGDDVALPHPPHRGDAEHRAAHAHAHRRSRGRAQHRPRRLLRCRARGPSDPARAPRVHHDRRRPEQRVARQLRRARRQGVHRDRRRAHAGQARACRVAARARALRVRDEPAGDLRRGRRAGKQRQARGGGGGRGLGVRADRPPRPGRVTGRGGYSSTFTRKLLCVSRTSTACDEVASFTAS